LASEEKVLTVKHSTLKKLFAGGMALAIVSYVIGGLASVFFYSGFGGSLGAVGLGIASVPSFYFLYLKILALKITVTA
jgi:hypothetical protein